MNKSLSAMRLLIADTQVDSADRVVALLEQHRIPVLARRVADRTELVDSLRMGAWDLVMIQEEAREFDVAECAQTLREKRAGAALFVLTARAIDLQEAAKAWRQGLAGIVSVTFPDYLVMAVGREFVALRNRRRKHELARENAEIAERCRLLLESSRQAIAYLHEGMHIYANGSYLEVFGFADMEDARSKPFMDLAVEGEKEGLRERLRHAVEGEPPCAEPITARRLDGTPFEAAMTFSRARYEGERCLQVLVESASAGIQTEGGERFESRAKNKGRALPGALLERTPTAAVRERKAGNSVPDEANLRELLSAAIAQGSAVLSFQPVIAIEDLVTEFHEMAVSIQGPQGALSRADWLACVNDGPLGRKLDRWAMEKALRELAEHNKQGEALQFILPATASSLTDRSFPAWLAGRLSSHRMEARAIVIDFRLADILAHGDEAQGALEILDGLGFGLCASGVGQPGPLLECDACSHIHLVKMQASTAQKLSAEHGGGGRLPAIAQALRAKGMKVIVPDVNDTRLLSLLWAAGIELVQGNLLPVSDDEEGPRERAPAGERAKEQVAISAAR